jgi:hypothetical protein
MMRFIDPAEPIFDEVVTGTNPIQSSDFDLGGMAQAQVGFIVEVGSGLTATFQILVSNDGEEFYNSGQILPAASGSAVNFIAQYSGPFRYVAFQVSPQSGSGSVLVEAFAKGSA